MNKGSEYERLYDLTWKLRARAQSMLGFAKALQLVTDDEVCSGPIWSTAMDEVIRLWKYIEKENITDLDWQFIEDSVKRMDKSKKIAEKSWAAMEKAIAKNKEKK
jgi:hypothetical protein